MIDCPHWVELHADSWWYKTEQNRHTRSRQKGETGGAGSVVGFKVMVPVTPRFATRPSLLQTS